jgi:phosphatidylinositol-3-phosphatase
MLKTGIRALLTCAIAAATLPTWAGAAAGVPNLSHVYIVLMENHEFSSIVGSSQAPFINNLIAQYGLETAYTAVTHPSLPNYMAITGGDTFFTDDCTGCTTPAPNIADEIEASGRTWKAYQEDMPAPCTTTDSGLYAQRHNPFIHYSDIVDNAARCQAHVVPLTDFGRDLDTGALPSYVWITPNVCNDMHDCSIATGDAWLQQWVPPIMSNPSFATSALFLVWDEGTTSIGGGGQVPLIVISPLVPPAFQLATPADHFSLLRTIEDAWSLGALGQSASAASLTGFFQATTAAPTALTASANGSNLTISWHAPAGPTPSNYVLEIGTAPGLSNLGRASTGSAATTLAGTSGAAGSFYLRVKAQSSAGLSPASNDSVLALGAAPGQPTNLIAASFGSFVSISWRAPTTGGAPTSYIIDVGSAPGLSDVASIPTGSAATSLSGGGAVSGVYYLRVRAQNASGTSFPSNEAYLQVP